MNEHQNQQVMQNMKNAPGKDFWVHISTYGYKLRTFPTVDPVII